jgi:hypothetical protein
MSIHDVDMPLVDFTHDGEARPIGTVKDEPVDEDVSGAVKNEPVDERDKQHVVDDNMYNFHQYYDPSRPRKYY